MPDNIAFSSSPEVDLKNFLGSRTFSKISVLSDTNTARHCYPVIKNALPPHKVITIQDGEEFKTLETCEFIWTKMTEHQLDRHSVLIIIGGGVLGDMGGFCAGTYKRGIDFILIPTTLLAQVDASIGGKLGIDFLNFKNHIGIFQNPVFTLLHVGFLKTLSNSQKRSGFAEVIKHALISDRETWNAIRKTKFEDLAWDEVVKHSVSFKQRVASEDPKERGLRKILNAGHTIGHAIEAYFLSCGKPILHGEAVAAGLITECFLAVKRKMLDEPVFHEIRDYIFQIFGKVEFDASEVERISNFTLQDKKNKDGKILSVLLEGVGTAKYDCEISLDEVRKAVDYYRSA
jgi:3-dehydroquinate synthase